MKTVGASKFKEQCLSLLENLPPEGTIITKRGKPVARIIPYPSRPEHLVGALKGRIRIHGDIQSTGEVWDANGQP
ncbi:MAG: hypothetical protein VX656_13575 [Candidatus Latescibacterota bacterium]|nr:hypothetical protein [Candidatus Latescibacterota bacterium]